MEIRINLQVYAYYDKDVPPPTYRLWVNNLLFGERNYWIDFNEFIIDELIIVDLEPGEHFIKLEKVRPRNQGHIWYQSFKVFKEDTNEWLHSIEIPTKDIVLSDQYLIPFTLNSIQENTR